MHHQEEYSGFEADPGTLTITDVQTQRRNEVRRSIFVNGEFALGVSEEIYVKFALFKGRVVTEAFLEEVRREDELYRCKQTAIRYLGRRMRSTQEVERKLAEKGFLPEPIAATLKFLDEYRMLDDQAFAKSFINDQLLRRPVGRRRLNAELRRKGLAKDEITESIASSVGDEDELSNAFAAAAKKAPNIRHDDPRKWDRTMASFLAGRGFGWDVVDKVLAHYRKERKNTDAPEEEE